MQADRVTYLPASVQISPPPVQAWAVPRAGSGVGPAFKTQTRSTACRCPGPPNPCVPDVVASLRDRASAGPLGAGLFRIADPLASVIGPPDFARRADPPSPPGTPVKTPNNTPARGCRPGPPMDCGQNLHIHGCWPGTAALASPVADDSNPISRGI